MTTTLEMQFSDADDLEAIIAEVTASVECSASIDPDSVVAFAFPVSDMAEADSIMARILTVLDGRGRFAGLDIPTTLLG